MMQESGYHGFKMHDHTTLWKARDGKNPGRGYGVMVGTTWYWYERWIDEVKRHCESEEHREKYAEPGLFMNLRVEGKVGG